MDRIWQDFNDKSGRDDSLSIRHGLFSGFFQVVALFSDLVSLSKFSGTNGPIRVRCGVPCKTLRFCFSVSRNSSIRPHAKKINSPMTISGFP